MAFAAEVVGSNGTGKSALIGALTEAALDIHRTKPTGFRRRVDTFRRLGFDLRYLVDPTVLRAVLKLQRAGHGILGVRLVLVYAETRRQLWRNRSAPLLLVDESFSKKLCDQVPDEDGNGRAAALEQIAPELAALIARTYNLWILLECDERVLVERLRKKGRLDAGESGARILRRYRNQMVVYNRIADGLERRSFPVLRVRTDQHDPCAWLGPIRLAAATRAGEEAQRPTEGPRGLPKTRG